MTDNIRPLLESDTDLSDETKEQITALFNAAVDDKAAREIAGEINAVRELIRDEVLEEIIDHLDNYLAEALEEMSSELVCEANERIADMVYSATEDPEEFIKRAASAARETASDRARYRNNDEAPDSEAASNRASLAPHQGRNGVGQVKLGEEFDPRIAPYMDHAAKHGSQAMVQQAFRNR